MKSLLRIFLTILITSCISYLLISSVAFCQMPDDSSLYYSNASNIDDSIPYKVSEDEDVEDLDNTPILNDKSERNLFISAAGILFVLAVIIIVKTKPTDWENKS